MDLDSLADGRCARQLHRAFDLEPDIKHVLEGASEINVDREPTNSVRRFMTIFQG